LNVIEFKSWGGQESSLSRNLQMDPKNESNQKLGWSSLDTSNDLKIL
jgi:hypothetical protein